MVLNGISDSEFQPVKPSPDAADFLYVGELRSAKGIDTFIDALAELQKRAGRKFSAVLVGSGPDQEALTEQAHKVGIGEQISFPGAMPAREAFRLGRMMVVPSRAESLPYVVLEAAGAQLPLVSTGVGGIPEIFGPYRRRLIECDDHAILASALLRMVEMSDEQRRAQAAELGKFVEETFHVSAMADAAIAGYRKAIAARNRGPAVSSTGTVQTANPAGPTDVRS